MSSAGRNDLPGGTGETRTGGGEFGEGGSGESGSQQGEGSARAGSAEAQGEGSAPSRQAEAQAEGNPPAEQQGEGSGNSEGQAEQKGEGGGRKKPVAVASPDAAPICSHARQQSLSTYTHTCTAAAPLTTSSTSTLLCPACPLSCLSSPLPSVHPHPHQAVAKPPSCSAYTHTCTAAAPLTTSSTSTLLCPPCSFPQKGTGKTTLIQRLYAHMHSSKIAHYLINLDPAVPSVPPSSLLCPPMPPSQIPSGSGKTTLMQRLYAHMHGSKIAHYLINLDPAVPSVPYLANIDIRDTVNYKNVMKEYGLGPNGAILTSLNLFTTKIDEVITLVERRADSLDYVFIDTPGQIEIFTWSASGAIITEAFASTFPTAVCFVVDTPRAANPGTFISSMLYACGILYKTRLPLLLAFNKTDVARHDFAVEWMRDFEAFQAAVDRDPSYAASLSRSLCLALDEFYSNLHAVGVSAVTGGGINEFFTAVEVARKEYMEGYRVDLEKMRAEKEKKEAERQSAEMARFRAGSG
ncbi:unnamed protein product [Closterium sp. Naga37s-1]|nr:unnamed protein product [Closterium sp. Naga37s-1]